MDINEVLDTKDWDLFISHSFEDKETFVEPLANALSDLGVKVWYDKFALKLGDSLSRSIDEGLAKSKFGLVVISPSFIAKHWTEYELRGLTARELYGGKIILPIWHNVSIEDVLKFSPPLADKLSIKSDQNTQTQIALSIIEVIRPDILTQIHRRIAYYQSIGKGKIIEVTTEKISPGPVRHKELTEELIGRIRLVRAALLGVYTHSMDFWLDGFKRDAHPSKEVSFWEHVASAYMEYVSMATITLTPSQHDRAFKLIFSLMSGVPDDKLEIEPNELPENSLEILKNLTTYILPVYDIVEQFPNSDTEEVKNFFETLDSDIEIMPKDLPENIIKKIIKEQEDHT
jgi:hypothetical protein